MRAVSKVAALAAGALLASGMLVPGPSASAAGAACTPWTKTVVANGYGLLENLAFDGQGGMLLSEGNLGGGAGGLRLLSADGTRSTVVEGVPAPGGIVVDGRTAYFNSGNGMQSGLLNRADGALNKVDLDTGETSVVADGLVMPNGLVRLPDGDFVVSRDLGNGSMTRIAADGSKSAFAPAAQSTNGMAVDLARGKFYVDATFKIATVINEIDLANPNHPPRQIRIGGLGPVNTADDLVLGPDGNLYVTLNVAGAVLRVNPDTGEQCRIANGMLFASSVRYGAGPGWDSDSLYVTTFLGQVYRLTPPGA